MKTKTLILITVALLVFPALTLAEVIRPTRAFIYFNQDNSPHSRPVDFAINCYDIEGSGVFSFSASCPSYGCKILNSFDAGDKQISYCDLTGETEGKKFEVEKYSGSPVFNCADLTPYDFSFCDEESCKYVKEGNLVKEAESDEQLRQKEPEFFVGRECEMTFDIHVIEKGFFKSLLDSIRCFFMRLFGKNC